MCGIFGAVSVSNSINKELFDKSLMLIKHRGPDFDRTTVINEKAVFGHTRLSILDLSPKNHQPFVIDDRYFLTFNGEIFNYIELREELVQIGVTFVSDGDTEVVLQSYINWGEKCVEKFNGMWAFAIYDKKDERIFCSRDRFGIKPFNYHYNGSYLIFCSEIKPILNLKPELKQPNYNIIANYCYKGLGAQAEETWFVDVLRLLPGHNMSWHNGKLNKYKYWSYPKKIDRTINYAAAKEKFKNLFTESILIRMRSDVEVGSTLTSGLDSSSIVGVLKSEGYNDLNTFTAFSRSDKFSSNDKVVFKDNDLDLDESKIVNKLNEDFKTKGNLIEVSFNDYISKLKEITYYLESGHSSPATICMLQVHKRAKSLIKVMMEGQGADELLGGYVTTIFPYHLIELLKRAKFKSFLKELRGFIKVYSFSYLFLAYIRSLDKAFFGKLRIYFSKTNVLNHKKFKYSYIKDNPIVEKEFDDKVNYLLSKSHSGGLVNLLHYGDALSMSQGIESRLPFMDYRLVEFAFQLPYQYKFNAKKGKLIQRDSLKEFLPKYIYESLIKIGFATPVDKLLKQDNVKTILLRYNYNDFFDNEKIKILYFKNLKGKGNYTTTLFKILSAKIWFNVFMENNEISLN